MGGREVKMEVMLVWSKQRMMEGRGSWDYAAVVKELVWEVVRGTPL